MRILTGTLVGIVLLLAAASPAAAEVSSERVNASIRKAVAYLRGQQNAQAGWGKANGLVVLALLHADVPVEDPAIQRGIQALVRTGNVETYQVALKALALCRAGVREDDPHWSALTATADWLVKAQLRNGMWTYQSAAGGRMDLPRGVPRDGDNSNTQFALLALHEASKAGCTVPQQIWVRSERHFASTQLPDGGWAYVRKSSRHRPFSYGSMTCTGLASLFIARQHLPGAGDKTDDVVEKGIRWITGKFSVQNHPEGPEEALYYYLYSLERVGMILGLKRFGDRDWYHEGASILMVKQKRNGSWVGGFGADIDTAFAVLFLAKGNRPLTLHKLQLAEEGGLDFDRFALDQLLPFLDSAETDLGDRFTKKPVRWEGIGLDASVRELSKAPILYITGSTFPALSREQRMKLRLYVRGGGTILAMAAPGRDEFVKGFTAFVKEAWSIRPLEDLPSDHPVFRSFYNLAGITCRVQGLRLGCRTGVFLLREVGPEDSLRLGANLCFYARESDRIAPVGGVPARDPGAGGAVPRVDLLWVGGSTMEQEMQQAAVARLTERYARDMGLPPPLKARILKPEELRAGTHKVVFLSGHDSFSWTSDQLRAIRAWLYGGGLLFANACCGHDAANFDPEKSGFQGDRELRYDFGTSLRRLVRQLYPMGASVLADLPDSHPVRGAKKPYHPLDGVRLRPWFEARIHREQRQADMMGLQLEGVKSRGRWKILYSRYSLTPELAGHDMKGGRGYGLEDAYRIAANILRFAGDQ